MTAATAFVSEKPSFSGPNADFIATWNGVLTPKWVRFRHLLSGNGQVHSDIAYPRLGIARGQRVLDVACGFGETSLELADRVGPLGSVLGIDCTQGFLEIAECERELAGVTNLAYRLADIENEVLPAHSFDVAVSRFGIMFCSSPVRALRAIGRALVPGGQVGLIAWRRLSDNPCWALAESIALEHLPNPNDKDEVQSCGPGPFSLSDRDTTLRIMEAAGFEDVDISRVDAELCIGRTLEEAIDYQVLVGPAGFVIREAGARGEEAAPTIRRALKLALQKHQRSDGSVWLESSTWFATGRTSRE